MKKKGFIVIGIIYFLFAFSTTVSAASGGIKWNPYEKGIDMAKKQNKKVFLYFHADWCTYCKQMERSTFRDLGVINYLNENFISIMVDTEIHKKIAANYGVRGLPTSWFLKASSEKLSTMPGYVDPEKLLVILKYIKTESYDKMSFPDFEKKIASRQ